MTPEGLTVVGIGIHHAAQVTSAALAWIESADRLFAEPIAAVWLRAQGLEVEELVYPSDCSRRTGLYREMARRVLQAVRDNGRVCVVCYGHPAVFNDAVYESVRMARAEGYQARLLPGISSEDCLLADLLPTFAERNLPNPFRTGWQCFEATDFLIRARRFDPFSVLILWQVAMLGKLGLDNGHKQPDLAPLQESLNGVWPADHELIVYQASFDGSPPIIETTILSELTQLSLTPAHTLVFPPAEAAPLDQQMMQRLGMEDWTNGADECSRLPD